jgi:hypothetical protein
MNAARLYYQEKRLVYSISFNSFGHISAGPGLPITGDTFLDLRRYGTFSGWKRRRPPGHFCKAFLRRDCAADGLW